MKKKTIVALVATAALAATLGLAGCGGSQAASSEAASSAAASESAAASASAEASAASSEASAATENDYLGVEIATATALGDAGIAEADTTDLNTELDTDGPVAYYDVTFKSAGMEYEYEIDAVSGEILNKSSEAEK